MHINNNVVLKYDKGSLILDDSYIFKKFDNSYFLWDKRVLQWRAPGYFYEKIISFFIKNNIKFTDEARSYNNLDFSLKKDIIARPHQKEGLNAWLKNMFKGVVSLPTGAGKTILAILAINYVKRPSLILVPTIDLLIQWEKVLSDFINMPIGVLGGGRKEIENISVATYDSALLMIENIGNKFGFLIADECHHLPAIKYQNIAMGSISPFRLGLSATVKRADGKENILYKFMGNLIYEANIKDMSKGILAPYDVISVEIPLSKIEYDEYKKQRNIYLKFLKKNDIDMSQGQKSWIKFIIYASKSLEGKSAINAYYNQKRLSQAASGKLNYIWKIIQRYPDQRIIIFTDDNNLAYKIGKEFILPVLTHKTKAKERKNMLNYFRLGKMNIMVTSKVLNEGVDVPEASVGVVVSGSGAVREHVQRLGRILRHRENKRARLYELISKGTSEFYVNMRRKRHEAYR